MHTSTHNLCAIVQFLKAHYETNQVTFRNNKVHSVCGLKEADITYLLTLLMLVRKPLYRLSISSTSRTTNEFWQRWLINDLHRLIEKQNGDAKLLPMLIKEQYILSQEDLDGRAFQIISTDHPVYAEICFSSLMDRKDWTAKGWCSHYDPFSEAWRKQSLLTRRVEWTSLLEMNCPSTLLAAMTKKSKKNIEMARQEFLHPQKRVRHRDCGPQLKLLSESRNACFFVFKASLIFKYCRSLGLSSVAAYYWAISEVKAISKFERHVPNGFWLEINVFYWLRANGYFDDLNIKDRGIGVDHFPKELRSYWSGCCKEKLPKFSLRHLNFSIKLSMEPDLKRFILRLNTSLENEEPLLPVFYDYLRGAL